MKGGVYMNVGDKVSGKVVKVRDDGLVIRLKDGSEDVFAFLHISRVSTDIAEHFQDYFRVDDTVSAYVYQYGGPKGKCMLTSNYETIQYEAEQKKMILSESFASLAKQLPLWIESSQKRKRHNA